MLLGTSFVLLLIPYLLNLEFISDDFFIIHSVLHGDGEYFGDWVNAQIQMFRPLISLSYLFSYKLFHNNYFFYYLQNVIIHIINAFLVLEILKVVFKEVNGEKENSKALLGSFLFLISPPAISNIYWIAGRTDIFVSFFGFALVLITLNISKFQRTCLLYFLSVILVVSLGFLSKETMLVFIFYSLVILLFFYKNMDKNKRLKYAILIILLSAIYFLIRMLIFSGNAVGKFLPNLEFSFSYFFKIIIYDLFSIFIPFDILDFFAITQSGFNTQIFYLTIVGVPLLLLIYLLYHSIKKRKFKIILMLSLVLFLSTSIYFLNSYPQIRLMYAHVFLFYLIIAILTWDASQMIRITFLSFFIISQLVASFFVIRSFDFINKYHNELANKIKSIELVDNQQYLLLTNLGRVGQRWANPNIKISSYFWKNYNFENKYNNFNSILFYETSSINNNWEINYSKLDSNSIIVSTKNDYDGFSFRPARKFSSLKDTVKLYSDSIYIIPKEFVTYRFGLAKTCEIHFVGNLDQKHILFLNDNSITMKTLKNFINSL